MKDMQIIYTKEGMKIKHPTGVVQILSVEALTGLKTRRTKRIAEINSDIAHIDGHIAEAQKIVNHG